MEEIYATSKRNQDRMTRIPQERQGASSRFLKLAPIAVILSLTGGHSSSGGAFPSARVQETWNSE